MKKSHKDYTLKNDSRQDQVLRVVELFAGVGGFRLGLEGAPGKRKKHNKRFRTVWFNQWEPATKRQHAHEVYTSRFGYIDENTNKDIATVIDKVPDHDLLVGGFPCQDYSVARNLSAATGLVGKKGVLWWSIHGILAKKGRKAPNYLMLENVDRLIKSPASRRGRDFAIILASLNSLGYLVEWRIINAADYGMPQRRRRIFIMGYKKGSPVYERYMASRSPHDWILKTGVMSRGFPAALKEVLDPFELDKDVVQVSDEFNKSRPDKSPFGTAGIAFGHRVHTCNVSPAFKGAQAKLADFLEHEVDESFYIKESELERWRYLKGKKNEKRKAANGYEFTYTEGPVAFPDPLDKPSRTIITGEGGSTPSRFKHVIKVGKRYRRLTPIELESLCMFPLNHTAGQADTKRAFFMGNALVVGVVERLGAQLGLAHFEKTK